MPRILLFCAGVVVCLAASWLLVSRLERLAERTGFSEAWRGLVAAVCLITVAAVVGPGRRACPDRRSARAVRGGPGDAPGADGETSVPVDA